TCFRSCSEYAFFDMAVPPFLPIYKQFTTDAGELSWFDTKEEKSFTNVLPVYDITFYTNIIKLRNQN
ncbi:hypothetical protein AB1I64_22055, partial [[Clostridium] symbiosum]